jgi:hypothetical protein
VRIESLASGEASRLIPSKAVKRGCHLRPD